MLWIRDSHHTTPHWKPACWTFSCTSLGTAKSTLQVHMLNQKQEEQKEDGLRGLKVPQNGT